MRLQLDLDEGGRRMTIRTGEHRLIPAQLAAAVARAIETALLDQLLDTGPSLDLPDRQPHPPLVVDGDDDRAVRREALRLLDEDRLTAAEVCARLGISRAQLRRWDDDLALDMEHDDPADVVILGPTATPGRAAG